MEKENTEKKNPYTLLLILILLLLLVIAGASVISSYYLFSINLKLSLLPKMDFSGIQNSLQQIGNSLDIGVLDIFK